VIAAPGERSLPPALKRKRIGPRWRLHRIGTGSVQTDPAGKTVPRNRLPRCHRAL